MVRNRPAFLQEDALSDARTRAKGQYTKLSRAFEICRLTWVLALPRRLSWGPAGDNNESFPRFDLPTLDLSWRNRLKKSTALVKGTATFPATRTSEKQAHTCH